MAEGTSAAEAIDPRIPRLFAKAGVQLELPQLVSPLKTPPSGAPQLSLPGNSNAARQLLAQQRINAPGYKAPERQLRHRWSTTWLNEKSDQAKWTFTKHEVAKAFDELLCRDPFPPLGIARAVLSHAPGTSLDELWCHLHDPKLEKRTASRFKRSRPSTAPKITWLNAAATLDYPEYARLMCHVGVAQDVLDEAFNIAMSKRYMDVVEVFLTYGAIVSASAGDVRECFARDDVALAKLLLSKPNSISIDDWRYAIEWQAASCPKVLVLCLLHQPSVATGPLLLEALRSENLMATGIMLAHASSDEDFRFYHERACRLASVIQDSEKRRKAFAMLAESQWLTDTEYLQEELMKDVKLRELGLVRLLTDAGVVLDIEPNNAFTWAVSRMDLELLELFENGRLSSPISTALMFIPDSSSEQEMLNFFHIFRTRQGLAGETLNLHLIRATQKQHRQLAQILMTHGASVEFREASAICTAILQEDFETLGILLRGKCSMEILSYAVPFSVTLKSRLSRFQVVTSLTNKGVLPQVLGTAMQSLLSEEGDLDVALIQLLLQHLPNAESINNEASNCILAATRRGNLQVLGMLCNAWPRMETLSKAIPVAFEMRHQCGYNVAHEMIYLLLEKGAAPTLSAHDTLLAAVSHDDRLDIVSTLLAHGANANHRGGACFYIAIESKDLKLLQLLCNKCPPDQASVEFVLFKAMDARWYNEQALQLLLQSSPASASALNSSLNSAAAFVWFKTNQNTKQILPCLLRYGLDVNVGNGTLLTYAIENKDVGLLKDILSAKPSIPTLRVAFSAATTVLARDVRLKMMDLLLWQANSAEIGQSELLWQLTHSAIAGDSVGLELVLRHRAAIDFDNGSAVQIAAHSGALEVLDLLLVFRPAPSSIKRSFLAVLSSSLEPKQKQSVYERLLTLDSGLPSEDLSSFLSDALTSLPESMQLVVLLLARGAEPTLETIKFAMETCSRSVYTMLLSRIRSADVAAEVFKLVRSKTRMPSGQRYEIYKVLLGKGIPKDAISGALIDALKGSVADLDLPKVLLEHGATVSYQNGKAFRLALLGVHSVHLFKLLVQYIEDDNTAGIAFDLARKHSFDDPYRCVDICRALLLQWNIRESSLYDALENSLKPGHSDPSLVQLLLRKGANPNNNNARCFVLASSADAEAEFRALSRHANLAMVLQSLLNNFQEEGQIVRWFNICLEERPHGASIADDQLLFHCLEKFPNGTALLTLLLDNGVSASAMKTCIACPSKPPEQCTALLWTLLAKPTIENDTILTLLHRGGDSVNPAYSTPALKVSAAFICLVDRSRTPILKALLERHSEKILSHEIPGHSFGHLGAFANVTNEEIDDLPEGMSLHLASLYLGNFGAFELLNSIRTPNDGLLHTVALLALPSFVRWLLKTDDANYQEEEFDQRIPLAVVCEAKPLPWSKVANEEANFRKRQEMTMLHLAEKTNLDWRYRGKTVFHIALENGIETTRAMMYALKNNPGRDRAKKCLYTDREGKEYSLSEYVAEFVDGSEVEKKALVKCLVDAGCGAEKRDMRKTIRGFKKRRQFAEHQ